MKRTLSLFLLIVMLTSALVINSNAADERSGITIERTTVNNYNHPNEYYVTEKKLEKMPRTFEAWVYIPKNVYSKQVGVIVGNYVGKSKDNYFILEIQSGGIPKLTFGDSVGNKYEYLFSKAIIPADTWTHLAVVYGSGNGKQVSCYLDGTFKQSSADGNWYEAPEDILNNTITLASDKRMLNERAFRGVLSDVVVYSDVRTANEIRSDFKNLPDTLDEELMMYYSISADDAKKDLPDRSGNGYDMTYCRLWFTEEEMAEVRKGYEHEYSYVIAFLPDTQYMTQLYPKSLRKMFDYLVDKGKSMNIKYIIGLGDITNANGIKEWSTVIHQTNRLNGYIPYSLVPGNHDVLLGGKLELFNMNYGKKTGYYYQHVAATGGFMDQDSVRNTYLTFSVGDIDYIIINLDFGATDDILEWAGSVLAEHPNHRAILATHGYLAANGTTLDDIDSATPPSYDQKFNSGEDMWERLVSKYENIDMIVSGHISMDSIVCTPREGDAGNTVYQILMDPQSTCKKLGGIGAVGLMYFTEDGNHARVEYYSTVFDKYFCESNKLITLTFGEDEPEETTAPETPAPVTTAAPVESTDTEPIVEKSGCAGIISAASVILVVLCFPIFTKKKRES